MLWLKLQRQWIRTLSSLPLYLTEAAIRTQKFVVQVSVRKLYTTNCPIYLSNMCGVWTVIPNPANTGRLWDIHNVQKTSYKCWVWSQHVSKTSFLRRCFKIFLKAIIRFTVFPMNLEPFLTRLLVIHNVSNMFGTLYEKTYFPGECTIFLWRLLNIHNVSNMFGILWRKLFPRWMYDVFMTSFRHS